MNNKDKQLIRTFITYFDSGYGYDAIAGCSTFELGLCDLQVKDDKLEVTIRRPGLLIGKRGRTLKAVEKYIGVDIVIKEKIFI